MGGCPTNCVKRSASAPTLACAGASGHEGGDRRRPARLRATGDQRRWPHRVEARRRRSALIECPADVWCQPSRAAPGQGRRSPPSCPGPLPPGGGTVDPLRPRTTCLCTPDPRLRSAPTADHTRLRWSQTHARCLRALMKPQATDARPSSPSNEALSSTGLFVRGSARQKVSTRWATRLYQGLGASACVPEGQDFDRASWGIQGHLGGLRAVLPPPAPGGFGLPKYGLSIPALIFSLVRPT